jgi:hypothetical protein
MIVIILQMTLKLYNSLENTLWKRIFCNDIVVHNCNIKNTMETKLLRTCPHKFNILNNYEYLCWFDSKLQVYELKVEFLHLFSFKTPIL